MDVFGWLVGGLMAQSPCREIAAPKKQKKRGGGYGRINQPELFGIWPSSGFFDVQNNVMIKQLNNIELIIQREKKQ